MTARRLAIAIGVLATAGCGITRLQTARTVPRGATQTTIGVGMVHTGDRGFYVQEGIPAVPVEVMVRHGATHHVDWGIRNFFGLGLLGDVKWNLLSPERRTALAISSGIGTAFDQGGIVHVPLTVSASHAVRPWFTPCAALGYGAYWIFGYKQPDPGVVYASRSGTGDGLLMLHAGIELARASGRAVLFEYSVGFPVVNDPGDFYQFRDEPVLLDRLPHRASERTDVVALNQRLRQNLKPGSVGRASRTTGSVHTSPSRSDATT